jgi:hypothetical protein
MSERRSVPAWAAAVVAAALALPLVVAVVQMRSPTWRPVLDLAMTELRVRDVGTRQTPLIGLPGRIGETLEEQGSHPGPLSFYAIAPTYRLLGSSAWAMQAGSALVHLVAIGVALALARRRGGPLVFAGVALLVAVLVSGLGSGALTEPWNPYLPLLWWVVLLLAVWSVLDGDVAVLPVAVVAGSFCAQTHVPYLSLSVGLGAGAAAWAVVLAARAPAGSPLRRRGVRAVGAAAAVGFLLWLPPTVDQLREDPGNYAKLVDHFTTPPGEETPIGLRSGAAEALQRVDPWHLGSHAVGTPALLTNGSPERFPSAWRGAALVAAWLAAVAVTLLPAWRERRLLALHALVGAGFLLGAVSISRIFGLTWYYLMLWMWAIGGLMVLATAWTAWRVARRSFGADRLPSPASLGAGLAVVAALVTAHTTAADAVDAVPSDAEVSWVLADIVPDTIAALERGDGAATGRDGRYHVTWRDAFHIGSQGFGLMSELERAGFDAGLAPLFRVPATEQRVISASEATAQVLIATGVYVDQVRAEPGAVEVARVDPRSEADVRRATELLSDATEALVALGLTDVVEILDTNLFGAAVDPRVPAVVRRQLDEVLAIGTPTSVFVLPPAPPA